MEVIEPQSDQVKELKYPSRRGRGRKAKQRQIARQLRDGVGSAIDKTWLLAELMDMYSSSDLKARDKLSVLEMIARISGYTGKNVEEPEDERAAINELMRDMKEK